MAASDNLRSNTESLSNHSFWNLASLDSIFSPKTVALITPKDSADTLASEALSALLAGEFRGKMLIVGPQGAPVQGIPTFSRLSDVPDKVSLAVAVTSPTTAPDMLAECVQKDVRGVILLSSGYGAESGRDAMRRRMREALQGSKTRVVGPNSLGVMVPGIGLNATAGLPMPIGGTVAFLSESSIVGRSVLDWSHKHLVGFSAFVTLGSMLDVSWANLIDHFGRDPQTQTIAIQISSIGDARSFLSAAREVSLNKPIIVVKAGRGDAFLRAVAWPSRCVPSDDEVLSAALRRVGVLQVETLEDLFHAADALSKQPRPRGPRLMVISNADGAGVMAADSVIDSGGEVAQPSSETRKQFAQLLPADTQLEDVFGDRNAQNYIRAVEVAAQDPECDGLLLLMVPAALSDAARTAELLLDLCNRLTKPILISYIGSADSLATQETLVRACIPTFSSPRTAARVFRYMWRYSYDLQSLYETPALHENHEQLGSRDAARAIVDAARCSGRLTLSTEETSQVLAAYGLPSLDWDGGASSQVIRFRVKLGSRSDPQFGPIVIFGSADRGRGVYGDMAIGLPPLNATLARRVLEQSALYRAMERECDSESLRAVEAALVRFSRLIAEQPGVSGIEIDPLLVWQQTVLAANAHFDLHTPNVSQQHLPRPAIRPYPSQYVSAWTMKNGESVIVRPIRAEDEPLMVKFHQGLSDRSVYLRYFQKVKLSTRTAHHRLSRVCFLDYDREMALLAEHCDPESNEHRVIAVATLTKIPPRSEGEVAVLISDHYHGQGLGNELIARLVGFARDEGLKRVTASTMSENTGMCAVFEKLGFQLYTNPEDQLVDARLYLE